MTRDQEIANQIKALMRTMEDVCNDAHSQGAYEHASLYSRVIDRLEQAWVLMDPEQTLVDG